MPYLFPLIFSCSLAVCSLCMLLETPARQAENAYVQIMLDFNSQNKNVVLVNKLLYKCSKTLFVHSVQVYDLSFLYVTIKEICDRKEWLYNHIKFAMDGHVFAESWTFLQTEEKSL